MLLITAQFNTTMISDEQLRSKLNEFQETNAKLAQEQNTLLTDLRDTVKESSQVILSRTTWVGLPGLRLLRQFHGDMKKMVLMLWQISSETYHNVLFIRENLPKNLSPCTQEPVWFEDALRRVAPVHLEITESWNAFTAVLTERFDGLHEYDKILRDEHSIQDSSTRKESTKMASWKRAFPPGRKVYMNMDFRHPVL